MNKEQLDKLLDKIPTDKVYEDLLQPGLKKVGEALANVFDLGNLILLPFKLVNERSRVYLKHNLEKYEKKLAKIKDEDKCQVNEQIGLPIVEKLMLTNQDELSEIFINLLTKASSTKTLYLAHPAFITILNNLSQDEAIILFANKQCDKLPFIDINLEKTTYKVPKPQHYDREGPKSKSELLESMNYSNGIEKVLLRMSFNLTGIEKQVKLYFPDNIHIYLENLERSGIIRFNRDIYYERDNEQYEKLTNEVYFDDIKEYENIVDENNIVPDTTSKVTIIRGYIEFTDFGKAFVDAVIKDIDEVV